MHEMGIALQIIEIAAASIPAHLKHVRVAQVNLKIGKLTAVVPDSLRFCFDVAARETLLDGAVLNIEEKPVTARCKSCRHEWIVGEPVFVCEQCGSGDIEIISGRELDIQSIEILDEDD